MKDIMEGISPLPWSIEYTYTGKRWIDDAANQSVADLYHIRLGSLSFTRKYNDEANAAYIIHACNLYPELVEALKELRSRRRDQWRKSYERNGPKWTSPDGRHLENSSDVLASVEEDVEFISAVLAKCKAGAE
jgi:hypothetical protein